MSVVLLTQREIEISHFLSATEQAGGHSGQPEPGDNEGSLRPIARDELEDFSYAGTTSGAGAANGSTVVDTALDIFGDDFFIGGTVTVGANTRTVTDFARSTGTLTVSPVFPAQVGASDSYTLLIEPETRSFAMELIAAGDTGVATFKWSHNAGMIYLGRNNPNQASWLAEKSISGLDANHYASPLIRQLADGRWIIFYGRLSSAGVLCCKSVDRYGLAWGSPVLINGTGTIPTGAVILRYGSNLGRIIVTIQSYYTYYSDDDGDTWTQMTTSGLPAYSQGDLLELVNGTILRIVTDTDVANLRSYLSMDGGFTWSNGVLVDNTARANMPPSAKQLSDGTVICAFRVGYPVGVIKVRRSTDGCASWGTSATTVLTGANSFTDPHLEVDIDGSLYLVASEDAVGIVFSRSTDGGITWSAKATVTSTAATMSSISLISGHDLIIAFITAANAFYLVRRGMWELYSANACPCAPSAMEQFLICHTIKWYGGAGIIGDTWTWVEEYTWAMSNIIEPSPVKSWRSLADNAACAIVIDMGATRRILIDGIGIFGCNIKTLSVQLNDTNSWGAPSVDQSLDFGIAIGAVDAVSGNAIQDTSLLANYKDHQLKGMIFIATAGTDNGKAWNILDNVGSYLLLDISAATGLAPTDTFAVYVRNKALIFTNATPYRYLRLYTAAQQTPEDHYEIGTVIAGRRLTLTTAYGAGFRQTYQWGSDYVRSPGGGIDDIRRYGQRRIWDIEWPAVDATKKEIEHVLNYAEGNDLVLIPNDTVLSDCYLVKRVSDLALRHQFIDTYEASVTFEEVL